MPNKNKKKKIASNAVTKPAPAAVGTKKGATKQPVVTYNPDGSCVVKHSEYITDVSTGNDSTYTSSFAVNPQRTATFPWLSAIATRFEMYKFRRLAFHYRPSTGTATDGWIALGFDFDFYDEQPTKSGMLVWKYSAKSAVWQSCTLNASGDSRLSTMRYCNYAATNGDARLDMLGNLWVLVETPSTHTIGEIYVDYEVEFRQPAYKIPPSLYAKVKTSGNKDYANIWDQAVKQGNMLLTNVAGHTVTLNDVGEFFVDFLQWGNSIATTPIFNVTQPIGSPGSEFSFTSGPGYHVNGNQMGVQGKLKVMVPPVNLSVLNNVASTASAEAELRIATGAYSVM